MTGTTEKTEVSETGFPLREVVVSLVADIVFPAAVYYVLRGLGFSEWLALLIGAAGPLLQACYTLARKRTVDWLAIIVVAIIAASIATSLVSGSPRFLLAKDGWITGGIAIAIFTSLFSKQPAMFMVGRMMMRTSGYSTDDWDQRWIDSAKFRRVWRVLTVIWGIGVFLDMVLRMVMAYTLPIDTVPALSAGLWLVLLLVLQVASQIYLRLPSIKPLVFDN